MGFKRDVFNCGAGLLNGLIRLVFQKHSALISARLAEKIVPIVSQRTPLGVISFYCPGEIPEWRARTLLTKEPETIKWIETFKKGEVFWDIGANVGVYSLYAALHGARVTAFEPFAANYYLLNKNIELNDMGEQISALCIALSDESKLDAFYLQDTSLGGALNSFGEPTDWQGKKYECQFKQAMIGFTVDEFLETFDMPFPNHLKIDVDGIEDKIIHGARKTLADKRVKSILMELDTEREDYCKDIIDLLEESGLKFFMKEHAPELDENKFAHVYNHIFVRLS